MKEGKKPRNWGVPEISLLGRYLQGTQVKDRKTRSRQEPTDTDKKLKKTSYLPSNYPTTISGRLISKYVMNYYWPVGSNGFSNWWVYKISDRTFEAFEHRLIFRSQDICIFKHPMILQICEVTMSISTWDRVNFWIYLLNHNSNWYI